MQAELRGGMCLGHHSLRAPRSFTEVIKRFTSVSV